MFRIATIACILITIACGGSGSEESRTMYREAYRLYETGAYKPARVTVDRLLAQEPGFTPAHVLLGNLMLHDVQLEAAESSFRTALAQESNHVGALYGLARVLRQKQDSQGARELIDRAIEIDGGNLKVLHLKGRLHEDLGDLARALAAYRIGREVGRENLKLISEELARINDEARFPERAAQHRALAEALGD